MKTRNLSLACAFVATSFFGTQVLAQVVQVNVTVENLAAANSVSFAPLRVGFHNGTFDSFNNGQAATAPIISVAEGGSGADWFPAFMAAEPNATLGTVVPSPAGPLLPGVMASAVFQVDTDINRYFTFGSMVVPSNDHFIGNDNPQAYELFDASGNLLLTSITQFGRDVWDAGSEVEEPLNAAFLQGGVNALRIQDNENVQFDFAGLNTFNGLTTAAGYTFNNTLSADGAIYRIRFAVVPEPSTLALSGIAGLLGLCGIWHRRRS